MVIIQYINKLKYAFIFIFTIQLCIFWISFAIHIGFVSFTENTIKYIFQIQQLSSSISQFRFLFLVCFVFVLVSAVFLLQPITFGMVIVENNIKQIDISNSFQCVIQPAQQLSHFRIFFYVLLHAPVYYAYYCSCVCMSICVFV